MINLCLETVPQLDKQNSLFALKICIRHLGKKCMKDTKDLSKLLYVIRLVRDMGASHKDLLLSYYNLQYTSDVQQ